MGHNNARSYEKGLKRAGRLGTLKRESESFHEYKRRGWGKSQSLFRPYTSLHLSIYTARRIEQFFLPSSKLNPPQAFPRPTTNLGRRSRRESARSVRPAVWTRSPADQGIPKERLWSQTMTWRAVSSRPHQSELLLVLV
jgi:hypothetical protein